MMTYSAVISW